MCLNLQRMLTMHKLFTILAGIGLVAQVHAFPCFITMVKDNCWTNYNLNVVVTNPTTGKTVTTVSVPQGTAWARQQFNCQPADVLAFTATFDPVFWQNDVGKTYAAQHEWTLPKNITKGETAWNITVCYPAEFSEVPMPPEAGSNCVCNTKDIPPVPPQ